MPVVLFEYFMLASCLYFQMCGIESFMRQSMERRPLSFVLHFTVEILLCIIAIALRLPVSVFLVLVYGLIILSFRILHPHISYQLVRGIIAIFAMLMVELVCILYTNQVWYGHMGPFVAVEYNIAFVTVVLFMLMVQNILTICGVFWRMRKMKHNSLYVILIVKRIMESLWCYRLMEATGYSTKMLPYSILFVLSVVLDYGLVYDVEIRKLFRREEVRRAQLPINREEYYTKMEEEHLQIRSMFHDMKNQLMILCGNLETDSTLNPEVIAKMKNKIQSMGNFYHTGNAELNMILFDCRNRTNERNIDFDVVFQEGCLSFMKQEDINTIFVNALINAIEACSKIEEGERSIKVHVGSRLNDVIISIKNTMNTKKTSQGLKTSKKDKRLHGLGIPSIQRAANKYQGYVSITESGNYFQLVILFVREE